MQRLDLPFDPAGEHLLDRLSCYRRTQAMQKLMTPAEAAQMLGISVDTLAVWRCKKRYNLPYVKVGRSVKYRETDLLKFIESRVKGA
jgi:excisionase family DNA binding protein